MYKLKSKKINLLNFQAFHNESTEYTKAFYPKAWSLQPHHLLASPTKPLPSENQSKYVADDDHKFHPHPRFLKLYARHYHFQSLPMHQNRLYLLVQVSNQ